MSRASNRTLAVVFDGAHDGAHNLAIDEALLDAGTLDTSETEWLRFYTWVPHTISLGYFQRFEDFAQLDLPIVRRCTGGGAILHAHELTFALACDADVLPRAIEESYALVNRAILSAAREHGRDLASPARSAHETAAWCFAQPTGLDLVDVHGLKVVGSAQRRRQGRVLHHGSIVLARPPGQDFCGALDLDADVVATSFSNALADALPSLALERRAEFPDAIHARAEELVASQYGARDWLEKR